MHKIQDLPDVTNVRSSADSFDDRFAGEGEVMRRKLSREDAAMSPDRGTTYHGRGFYLFAL